MALPLGTTSSGEIVDFDVTEVLDPDDFRQRLAAQLPANIPLYRVMAIAPETPTATRLLDRADYYLSVQAVDPPAPIRPETWQRWVDEILAAPELWLDQVTKAGKPHRVNMRDRLHALSWLEAFPIALAQAPQSADDTLTHLFYTGTCRNDGTFLRPEHLIQILEDLSGQEFLLHHAHRAQLHLAAAPIPPKV